MIISELIVDTTSPGVDIGAEILTLAGYDGYGNYLANSTEESDDDGEIHFLICYYLLIPISTLIFILNIPVMLTIMANRKLHSPTFVFVLSLSGADLCVGCACLGKLIEPDEATYSLCLLRFAFLISPVCASVSFMFWIAVDRYLSISNPLHYVTIMTSCKCGSIVLCTWIYACLIGFAPLMGWNIGDEDTRCSFLYVLPFSYVLFAFNMAFFVPLFANGIIYIKIFRIARQHIRKIGAIEMTVNARTMSSNSQTSNHERRSVMGSPSVLRTLKAVRTLAIVLGCFMLTWGPFAFANLIQIICGYDKLDIRDLIGTYLLHLGYCNSFLNPLIYGFWNRDFRPIMRASSVRIGKWVYNHVCDCHYRQKQPTTSVVSTNTRDTS